MIVTAPGSHSLTPGSGLCLRIALRQLPLRKSTRADTLNARDAHRGRKRDRHIHRSTYMVINMAISSKIPENYKRAIPVYVFSTLNTSQIGLVILNIFADHFGIHAEQFETTL